MNLSWGTLFFSSIFPSTRNFVHLLSSPFSTPSFFRYVAECRPKIHTSIQEKDEEWTWQCQEWRQYDQTIQQTTLNYDQTAQSQSQSQS